MISSNFPNPFFQVSAISEIESTLSVSNDDNEDQEAVTEGLWE